MQTGLFLTFAFGFLLRSVVSQSPTPDGSCGGTTGFVCTTPEFGACCSGSGFCGDDINYCGAGCQNAFSRTDASCQANPPSVDGSCGAAAKLTCNGGAFQGMCCSKFGFCGASAAYCSTAGGCQEGFGAACTA